MPSLPAETPHCQTDKVSEALETLIRPLHQLLEAQATLEEGAAQQLAEIIDSLASLTASFETVLAGLSGRMTSETLSPALQAALDRIESRQTCQQRALPEISGQLADADGLAWRPARAESRAGLMARLRRSGAAAAPGKPLVIRVLRPENKGAPAFPTAELCHATIRVSSGENWLLQGPSPAISAMVEACHAAASNQMLPWPTAASDPAL